MTLVRITLFVQHTLDNDDVILRLYESTIEKTTDTVDLSHWDRRLNLTFKSSEIKTSRIPEIHQKRLLKQT